MAGRVLWTLQKVWEPLSLGYIIRHKRYLRGRPPEEARSLAKRLQDENPVDPALAFRVDIGLPTVREKRRAKALERAKEIMKVSQDPAMEKLAREGKLEVSLELIEEEWKKSQAQGDLKMIADYYGIFKDLFGDAYFYPRVLLDAGFPQDDNTVVPVYRGNVVKPSEARNAPEVFYEAESDSLWTLVLTNLDGHLSEENAEYVHWFIGNIPGNKISSGEEVFSYMPPFPPMGTGYHRLVFLLYKQTKKLDYSMLKKSSPCLDLSLRTFHTLEFYRTRQDDLTPAGLAFFQTDYDPSVKDIFHNMLNMKEPRFEYDFPAQYFRPQEWFPKRRPFNRYLDKYRDPRDINKEYFLEKLKKTNPFEKPPPKLKFPGAQRFSKDTPSWLKYQMQKDRVGQGRASEPVE